MTKSPNKTSAEGPWGPGTNHVMDFKEFKEFGDFAEIYEIYEIHEIQRHREIYIRRALCPSR
jgi:hypothetical protein